MYRKRHLIIGSGFLGKSNETLYRAFITDIKYYNTIEDISLDNNYHFIIIPYTNTYPIVDITIKHFKKSFYKKLSRPHFKLLKTEPSKSQYINNLRILKKHIENGDIYQANLAMRFKFSFDTDIKTLFYSFYSFQPVDFGFLFEDKDNFIISGSMELFIKKTKDKLISKPIKGTSNSFIKLRKSQKDKAENLMITDVMRNDLNEISNNAVVKHLFKITKYKTLFHMHTHIEAFTNKDIDIIHILKNTLPVASITGAPKLKATEIIKSLEPFERGYYCGIGLLAKGKNFVSSVLIRTLYGFKDKFYYYAGSGITIDSVEEEEFRENLLKAKFFVMKNNIE